MELDDRLAFLGRKLFFDARLSGTGRTACASCHDPGYAFAEPRRVSISDSGRDGGRNAPSLLDVGALHTLMWDGRFRTLEEQALSPFQRGEMGISVDRAVQRVQQIPNTYIFFEQRWGTTRRQTAWRARWPLSSELYFATEPRRPFLVNNETAILTPLEQHGLAIFAGRAACTNCHQLFPLRLDGRVHTRPLLMDFRFHNLGVGFRPDGFADTGRYGHSLIRAEWGAFRTPSLRSSERPPLHA